MRYWAFMSLAAMGLVLCGGPVAAQSGKSFSEQDFDVALAFFADGGSWAFRIVPAVGSEKETTWNVLVLRPTGSTKTSFQLGPAELSPKTKVSSASKVLDLYDADRATRNEFLRRYADRLENGSLEAQLVRMPPAKDGESVPIKAAVRLTKQGLLDLLK